MKKQALILACFMISLSTTIFAQKQTDLSARVIFPQQDGYEVAVGDTLKIMMSVKNLGTEDILPTDTLVYGISGFPVTMYSWDTIPAGDSIIIAPLTYINDGSDTADKAHSFCFYLIFDRYPTIDDSNPDNDTTCISFLTKGADNVGIDNNNYQEALNLNVYPNPTAEKVFLSYHNIAVSRIELMDISGRKLRTFAPDSKILDISLITPGMYLLDIRTADGKKRVFKIVKQ